MDERSKRDHLAVLAEPAVADEFSRQQEVEEEANDKQTPEVCCGASKPAACCGCSDACGLPLNLRRRLRLAVKLCIEQHGSTALRSIREANGG